MADSLPKNILVALPQSPGDFAKGRYDVVPAAEARISAFDRSFHFGDSIYEVARTYDGVFFGLKEHMERMKGSLKLAAFEEMPDFALLERMVTDTCRQWCQRFGHHDLYARWMVSRGVGDLNISRTVSSPPYGFVFVKKLEAPTAADFEKGYHYAIVSRLRNDPRAVDPHMKSGNYINNILALVEARARGAQDGILLDQNGCITEGTTNNVYAIIDGKVVTSRDDAPILEGVTRKWVFAAARELGIPVVARDLPAGEFRGADELFMSSSIKEIQPITVLDSNAVAGGKPGPLTRKLAARLSEMISADCARRKTESVRS